jgi:hypothetical protein
MASPYHTPLRSRALRLRGRRARPQRGPVHVRRQTAMVDELRKAELVRDWLEGLDQIARSYPEGHD